jgi:prephenate dehydrogenase
MNAAFRKVSIAGVGLIGGSLGMAARARSLADSVVGLFRREESIADAVSCGAVDLGTTDPQAAFSECDLLIAATPISAIHPILEEAATYLPPDAIVTDVCSTKAQVVALAQETLRGRARFVGGHPVTGSERTGVAAASPDLFSDSPYVLTETPTTDSDALERVRDFVVGLGARPVILDPETHDRILAVTSHLPHVVAAALMMCLGKAAAFDPVARELKGGGLKDTTRIASGDPVIWRDVLLTNAPEIIAALGLLSDELKRLSSAIAQQDAAKIEEFLSAAKEIRSSVFQAD